MSNLSKKSKPGDGSHGKGTKGMKHEEFETMFLAPAKNEKDEKPVDEPTSNESES